MEDSQENLIIVPEAAPLYLNQCNYAKKTIWWLSVDFFTKWATSRGRAKAFGWLHAFPNIPLLIKVKRVVKMPDVHFCQSYYSKNYLETIQKISEKSYIYYRII